MQVRYWKDRFLKACLLLLLFGAAGCVGVTHQAYYPDSIDSSTEGMTEVKDEKNKFDFMIPAGWTKVPEETPLPKDLELPREARSDTGRVTFRKEDHGAIVIWCKADGQTDYMVERLIYDIAPSCVMVKGPLQIRASGWNPEFHRYDASLIEEGEKKGFSFFLSTKPQALLSLFACNYVVVGRSSSLEHSDEIESDFIAVLRSLKN